MIHVGGRFEGNGDGKQYVGGELIAWSVDVGEIKGENLLCFVRSLKFVNIERVWFVIPGKKIVHGLSDL